MTLSVLLKMFSQNVSRETFRNIYYLKGGVNMRVLFSPSWWISTLVSTLVTMFFIYIIKSVAIKYSIPVVSTVAEGV